MSVRIRPGDEPAWQWPGDDVAGDTGPSADAAVADNESASPQEWVVRPQRNRSWLSDRWTATTWTRGTAAVLIGTVCLLVLGGLAYRLSVPAPTAGGVPQLPSAAPSSSVTSAPTVSDPADLPAASAPSDLTAVPWQGAALPVSTTAGPRVFTETRATGFSRDPQGAALAAVHISTHLDPYTGPAVFTPTITEQVVLAADPGADQAVTGTEAFVDHTQQLYEKAARQRGLSAEAIADGVPIMAPTGDISAWRIGTFRPDGITTVELLVTTPQGQRLIYEVPVVWRDGDWRVSFARGGSGAQFRVTEADESADFTTFIQRVRSQGGNEK